MNHPIQVALGWFIVLAFSTVIWAIHEGLVDRTENELPFTPKWMQKVFIRIDVIGPGNVARRKGIN